MKSIHLKIKREPFALCWSKRKFAELRFDDDKNFCIGDKLYLHEWKPNKKEYTGRWLSSQITDITRLCHWINDIDVRWVILHLDPSKFEWGTDWDGGR